LAEGKKRAASRKAREESVVVGLFRVKARKESKKCSRSRAGKRTVKKGKDVYEEEQNVGNPVAL